MTRPTSLTRLLFFAPFLFGTGVADAFLRCLTNMASARFSATVTAAVLGGIACPTSQIAASADGRFLVDPDFDASRFLAVHANGARFVVQDFFDFGKQRFAREMCQKILAAGTNDEQEILVAHDAIMVAAASTCGL
ncbi:MAG: hypothetical protein Q7R83_02675 [bacterium]|nr:hypothetical protein [bacterium]